MGVRKVEDLIAWQLAGEFRDCVYALFNTSPAAKRDFKFRDQLFDSSAKLVGNISEGFHRNRTREFLLFLSYARASLAEAQDWLRDGIARGYFTHDACKPAFILAKRCAQAILNLIKSLKRFL
jgi:four helix bundle protein